MSTDLAAFLGDLEASFQEVAATALGLTGMVVRARHQAPPALHGAYLGLLGPAGALQIGLTSDLAGCQALARGLLGMTAEEAPLADAEVADAVCEIINIVAGAFKTRVRDRASPLQMGLPVFIHGAIQPTDHIAVQVTEVQLGACPAVLLLVHPRVAEGG